MATELQLQANRKNALSSTGPKSANGKAIVSGNRLSHGILSAKLILDGECRDDYQALLDGLQTQLKPVGTLEFTLVEKIAVSIWRQQRLVRAETAVINLEANPRRIAHEVGVGTGRPGSIKTHDMEVPDPEYLKWCKAVIAELDSVRVLSLENLQTAAPLAYAQLACEVEDGAFEERLTEASLQDYLCDLRGSCFGELRRREQHPAMCEMADTAKDKLKIAWGKLQTLSAYESTLDNSLYKAMKALREAQQWRAESIDSDVVPSSNDIFEVA